MQSAEKAIILLRVLSIMIKPDFFDASGFLYIGSNGIAEDF
jgi:hypothetical protein